MNDLISRQAAIVQLSHNKTGDDDCDIVIQNDIETIKELPPVEPEIIKCKDCRHSWFSGTATIRNKSYKIYKCNYWDDRVISSNGYCWVAERRTDE